MNIADEVLPWSVFFELQEHAHNTDYVEYVNPIDDVIYPNIGPIVPYWWETLFRVTAERMGFPVQTFHQTFFRLTTEDTRTAPHQAHNDISHGAYSSFLYLNDVPPELSLGAGTSILRHKALGFRSPTTAEEVEAAQRDSNDYDAWDVDTMFDWKQNRLVIYPSHYMHRAEPVGGWGKDVIDGRLVLITFFS